MMSEYIITKIERQQKARHRVSIFLDGEFAFGAHDDVAYKFNLVKGLVLRDKELQEIKEYDAFLQAKNDALRVIARRKHSARELKQKLLRKKYDSQLLDRVIDHLRSIDLVDDAGFAKAFVRDRLLLRPAGRKSLMNELRKRGVTESIAANVLDSLLNNDREYEDAKGIAEKYFLRLQRYDAETQKRRLFGYLMRKGYANSIIQTIMREML